MRRLLYLVCCTLLLSSVIYSQQPVTYTSADMYLALRKLNVLGSVLYIAAHPDDENTRLLSYFSKDRMYRTGYLSLTRGDGGQNLIGNEQGIELGLIRTQELLSARRIDGAEQFFSRAFDFGFSKNPEETFTKWDREKILSDVVWVIRKFQPDIIITRFPTTGEGGHGHHTASAILANEAFTAAADPGRFPEQLKYVRVWQAKRIMWNTFNFGNTNTTSSSQFQLDVGGYNPLLGKSYGEIAAESRSQHKSQGFGVARSRGAAIEFFKTTGGNAPTNDLMDDVDLGWKKIPGGEKISGIIDSLSSSFDLLHPENSVKGLVRLYQALTLLPSGYWRDQKLKEVQQLVEQCSALFLDATTTDQFAVQTDTVKINFVLNNRLGVNAKLKELRLDAFDSSFMQDLPKNRNIAFSKGFFVPLSKSISQPYWLKETMEEGYFNVSDQQKIGQPDVDPAYVANMSINIEGQDFSFSRAVKYKFTDPVKGELYQPVFVIPAATVSSSPDVLLFTQRKAQADKKTVLLQANANKNLQGSAAAQLRSMDKDLWKKDPSFSLARNSSRVYSFEFDNENMRTRDNAYGFVHIDTGKDSLEAYLTLRAINYDHIPSVKYFYSDAIKLLNIDLKTVGKKIGYIVGAGDKVPEALEQMGYEVTLLADKDLAKNNLQQYDAIITGVRAYNTDFFLNSYYDKLMSYVSDGGNLIVQYNTNNNIGPVRARIGPYNFDIVNVRVTDENAQVNFLKPDHPILNFPNKITDEDFKGWRQERSIYHASNLDPRFETIFSMHDPGEASDNGALITTKYGKGTFTYTGIVFFRELPAGVPGAYRLLANLIALSNKKAF